MSLYNIALILVTAVALLLAIPIRPEDGRWIQRPMIMDAFPGRTGLVFILAAILVIEIVHAIT